MSWKKTSIIVKLGNENYPKGYVTKTFNNIVENPTKEQIDTFIEGLLLLTDGDSLMHTEIIRHDLEMA